MPPNNLSQTQAATIVAYLRSMAATEPLTSLPGDAARGQALVEGKGGCLTCHRIAGRVRGPGRASPMSGRSGGASRLERASVDPGAEIRPENRRFRVVTRDGATIIGRLLNQDTLHGAAIDDKERLRSFESGFARASVLLKSPDAVLSRQVQRAKNWPTWSATSPR